MRSRTIRRFAISFLAGAVMISACQADISDSSPTPAGTADHTSVPEIESPSPSPEGSTGMGGVQKQTAAGLTIEAGNMRFEGEENGGVTLQVDLCFPMPTNADWSIFKASLSFFGVAVENHGTIPIEIVEVGDNGTALVYAFENNQFITSERPALASEHSQRCDTLSFWGLPEEIRDAEFTITIDGLYASRNELQPCTSELLAKAQQAMGTRVEGIVLTCSDDVANGYAGLAIESIPEGISQDAAEEIFHSNDIYLALFGVAGPWVFTYPEK